MSVFYVIDTLPHRNTRHNRRLQSRFALDNDLYSYNSIGTRVEHNMETLIYETANTLQTPYDHWLA